MIENLPYGFEAESKLHAAMFHLSVRKPSPLSSFLNLAPILSHSSPSTFWGDSLVRFGSCDASGIQRSDNSNSIISDSTSIFLLQESVRFRFFFLSFLLIQFQSTGFALRWEPHCPLHESQYSPGWCQLSSSGHSDATSLPVNTASAASQCDLWWVCTVPALSACWCVMMPSRQ